MTRKYYIYILGNDQMTLYIGVTNDLFRRGEEHKRKLVGGFTSKYGLTKLLYYEMFDKAQGAIEREKQLKHWNRDWKIRLIKKMNPYFKDLWNDISV